MSIKLEDVAKIAGVSKATASLALNGSQLVKNETREKVLNIAKEKHYVPHTLARGLARKKSGIIGVIVPDIESEYYGKLVRHLDEDIRRKGYTMVLAISNDQPEKERKSVEMFIAQCAEGVIIAPINYPNDDLSYVEQLDENNIPVVYVTAYYPSVNRGCVMVDLEQGEYLLVHHLLDTGHKKILFLTGSHRIIPSISRIRGYYQAYSEKNLKVDADNIVECKRIDYEYTYNYIEEFLDNSLEYPDAIITVNDMMALGAINALRRRSIEVPDEISHSRI